MKNEQNYLSINIEYHKLEFLGVVIQCGFQKFKCKQLPKKWGNRDSGDNLINIRFYVSQCEKFTWDKWDKFRKQNFFNNKQYHLITIRSPGFKRLDGLLNSKQYLSRAVNFCRSTVL